MSHVMCQAHTPLQSNTFSTAIFVHNGAIIFPDYKNDIVKKQFAFYRSLPLYLIIETEGKQAIFGIKFLLYVSSLNYLFI